MNKAIVKIDHDKILVIDNNGNIKEITSEDKIIDIINENIKYIKNNLNNDINKKNKEIAGYLNLKDRINNHNKIFRITGITLAGILMILLMVFSYKYNILIGLLVGSGLSFGIKKYISKLIVKNNEFIKKIDNIVINKNKDIVKLRSELIQKEAIKLSDKLDINLVKNKVYRLDNIHDISNDKLVKKYFKNYDRDKVNKKIILKNECNDMSKEILLVNNLNNEYNVKKRILSRKYNS